MFSILIPTWNNLAYLKNCLTSISKHSKFEHQIIIIVNDGSDGTVEWLKNEGIEHIHFEKNVGICVGLNAATSKLQHDYVVYLNDDMYVLPNWDTALVDEIESIGNEQFMLSGTMIEPYETGNKCVVVRNFGDSLEQFKEKELLQFHATLGGEKKDWNGSTWPPVLLPTTLWKAVGGMSEEFSPGFYSDPDLSMKVWNEGTRIFKGVANSRVYHFGSKSTKKLTQNTGRKIFLKKWKISANYFYRNYLKMGTDFEGPLPNHSPSFLTRAIHRFK